jgi:4-amino-4-deoxy-L-arabinose transferase-like glycosyltransferase
MPPPPRSRRAFALALALVAVGLRLAALAHRHQVEGDGVHYASLARQVLAGDWSGLANPYWSNLWPGVVALASGVTGLDVVGGGRLASFAAGVALCLATAALGARLFGPIVGALAGLGAAVHPWLVQFSTLLFTESFFSLLLVLVALSGWRMLEEPRPLLGAAAGALAGLGLMTRPEMYGAVAVLSLLTLARGWRRGERRAAALAVAVFLAVAGAGLVTRALVIHAFYGEWDFGQAKGTANLLVGLQRDKESIYAGLDENGENRLEVEMRRWTVASFVLAHPRLMLAQVVRNTGVLAGCATRVFPPLPVRMGREAFVGTPLWTALDVGAFACLFVALGGLVHGLAWPGVRTASALCGGVVGVHLAGLAPLEVHDRMIVAVTPFFLILLARGAVALVSRFAHRAPRPREIAVPAAAALVLTAFSLARARDFDYATEPPVQRQAGLWLRERFPQDAKLMTVSPATAFYFYDAVHQKNALDFPWAEYPRLLAYARREGAGILAASEWQLRAAGFPSAPRLVPEGDHPGLTYVATVGEGDFRVHVFRVDPAEDTAPPP